MIDKNKQPVQFTAQDLRDIQQAARIDTPDHNEPPNNVQRAIAFVIMHCHDVIQHDPYTENTLLTADHILEGIGLDPVTTPNSIKELLILDLVDGLNQRGFRIRYTFHVRDIGSFMNAPIRIYWSDYTTA